MAKVKTFGATYGTSVEINTVWHKIQASIEVEIEEGDDIEHVKAMCHNTVQLEVQKQLEDLIDMQ